MLPLIGNDSTLEVTKSIGWANIELTGSAPGRGRLGNSGWTQFDALTHKKVANSARGRARLPVDVVDGKALAVKFGYFL